MVDYLDFEEYENYENWQKYFEWQKEIKNINIKLNNPYIADDKKERLRKRLLELKALVEKKRKSQRILPY